MSKFVKLCFLALICGIAFTETVAQEEGNIRLVNGYGSFEGRVEIFFNSQWGTVCDDHWDIADASVVCRQLGFDSATDFFRNAYFGGGLPTQPIYLDDVHCIGNETELRDCEHRGWGIEDCIHYEDAGVRCYREQNEGEVRLTEGPTSRDGRLEIYHHNKWGTVCNTGWGREEAEVACRQLRNDGVSSAYYRPTPGNGTIHLSHVGCYGSETGLLDCNVTFSDDGNSSCTHSEDVGVDCYTLLPDPSATEGDVRLSWHEEVPTFGQLQIYHDNSWGTVCSHGWSEYNTIVVCRQLGYPYGIPYGSLQDVGFIGPVHLSEVSCNGDEASLSYCPHGGWGNTDCRHNVDTWLQCLPDYNAVEGDIQLIDGETSWAGRLQVYHDYRWSTVCNDTWSDENALVVCHQLGYQGVVTSYRDFGPGYGPILLGGVVCSGKERTLTNCTHDEWGSTTCTSHDHDVGVECTEERLTGEEGDLRLVGGSSFDRGRLEIFHAFEWGTICNDSWSGIESLVACRQLGFYRAANSTEYFGAGEGPIHLDEVSCEGTESRLEDCSNDGWGIHDCSHYEDVGIHCLNNIVPEPDGDTRYVMVGWAIALIVIGSVVGFTLLAVIIVCLCSMKKKSWRMATSGSQVSGQTMPTGQTNSVALVQNGMMYYNPNNIPGMDGIPPPDYSECMADSHIDCKQTVDIGDPVGRTNISYVDNETVDSK